ncbi:MAG: T9SS type A sorting domain-containing protein [Chitinophagaceae bacterium]|nr:T9SS type A sorting domain-containing protein [Chitinophagaceae bacterium]
MKCEAFTNTIKKDILAVSKKYALLLLLPLCTRSQGITITPGASLALTGNATLTIQDGGLTNNGTFSAGGSTVLFSGTAATGNSFIGGGGPMVFYHLTVNKTSNDVLLNSNIAVNGNLTMQSGNLQLNNYTVDLGSGAGAILGENNNARITGTTGGTVNKTVTLNAPVSVNPGNIGVEITSTANLGSTLIKRGHVQQTSSGGGLSIHRYFDIIPTNNSALSANLKFYYFDNELAGRNKPELTQWESSDGGTHWSYLGQDQLDNTNDWVLKNTIATFSRMTLASNINNPLPVQLLYFNATLNNGTTLLKWATANEFNNDHFELERSPKGDIFTWLASIKSHGNSDVQQYYEYTDPHPFDGNTYYRLKQVDIDGNFRYSPIVSVRTIADFSYSTYPNPAKDKFVLSINATTAGEGQFVLTDLSGKTLSVREVHLAAGSNTCEWDISRLPKGVYFLRSCHISIPVIKIIRE